MLLAGIEGEVGGHSDSIWIFMRTFHILTRQNDKNLVNCHYQFPARETILKFFFVKFHDIFILLKINERTILQHRDQCCMVGTGLNYTK